MVKPIADIIGDLQIGGRRCRLFGSENPSVILVQPSARHENATLEAGKHAQETLQYVLVDLIPELQRSWGALPVILGGYSLGGLFALWASSQTDTFQSLAAASPSVWIHKWIPFAKKHPPMAQNVYLSLGDQEEHVKNQAIARVGDNLREQFKLLQTQLGPEHCTLVWEPGNHFTDNEGRLARAFAWCITCQLAE